jgi:hypothetical protein
MHESGTGGEPKYGVVAQTPLVGDLKAQGINVGNNWTYLVRLTCREKMPTDVIFRFPASGTPRELAIGPQRLKMVSRWT